MKEIFQIAQQIVVMKDGKFVTQKKVEEITEAELIRYMVGRDLGNIYDNLSRNETLGDVVLEVKNLCNGYIHDVSFQLHRGEILGFAGLVGAGRTETMRAIFGADKLESGEIWMEGKPVKIRNPGQAIAAGIGLCPEDRKDQGIFGIRSVKDNISVVTLKDISKGQWLDFAKEQKLADDSIVDFRIKTPDSRKLIKELSGGNQQKAILARWVAARPKVLILDEPTKGIDVGAKSEIYQMACDLAKNGISVIFISSELPEVIGVSDRILVMREGMISGQVMRSEATEEKILKLAMN